MTFNFLKFRKIYFVIAGLLIIGSFFSIFKFGLKPGIDFTGGSILEVVYNSERPSNQIIKDALKDLDLGDFSVQSTGEKGVILKMKHILEETHQAVIQNLNSISQLEEISFESVGPTIGKELKEKTTVFVTLSLIAIVIYIIIAFSNVTFPIKSWQYGFASLFILANDILIPLGVFSILGNLYGVQITIPVVTALLTVVGYAINNVVVVYDRLRENLLRSNAKKERFEELANSAISQTLARQINTSLTVLFALIFIFFWGGETLKYFSLALILGVATGLYSSIFLAIPMLVGWLKMRKKI
jgi:preprotein translocase subunit SecF